MASGVAGRRARARLLHLTRSAGSAAHGAGGRFARFTRGGAKLAIGLVGSAAGAARQGCARLLRSLRSLGRRRRPVSTTNATRTPFAPRRLALALVAALTASALSGIALGRALEVDRGPSSVTRSGLTIQVPPGWGQVAFNPGRPAVSPGIAIGPLEEGKAGLVAGRLASLVAAERMLDEAQAQDGRRVQVQLGRLDAWRYSGLRPRPSLVGTGYLVPTTGRPVVVVCHAPENARARLAECERAATTIVVRGERPRPLSPLDRSRERLTAGDRHAALGPFRGSTTPRGGRPRARPGSGRHLPAAKPPAGGAIPRRHRSSRERPFTRGAECGPARDRVRLWPPRRCRSSEQPLELPGGGSRRGA